jgi:hypothetical protein
MSLADSIAMVLQAFEPALSGPTWSKVQVLINGTLFGPVDEFTASAYGVSMTNAWRETLMPVRMLLIADIWAEIEPILATSKHKAGSPLELSDRQFREAVLYLARTGSP